MRAAPEAPHGRVIVDPASNAQGHTSLPAVAPIFPASRTAWALNESGTVAFDALAADFEQALESHPQLLEQLDVRLAGFPVRIRVIGAELAGRLMAALRAREAEHAGDPALTIDVWDEHAAGVACAAAPTDRNLGPYGTVTCSPDGRFVACQRADSTSWLDTSGSRIVAWFRSPARLLSDERAKPFHKLLAMWLRGRGVMLAHAGLVARGGKGVLVTGKGGQGKSTTTLAAMLAGFEYLGDDFVALSDAEAAGARGHALFCSALLEHSHLRRFPALRSYRIESLSADDAKSLLLLANKAAAHLPPAAEIAAIVLPRVVDRASAALEPAAKAAALQALALSTLALLPRPERAVFDGLARIVERTPTYWLDLGRDIGSIAPCLESLLRGGAKPASEECAS